MSGARIYGVQQNVIGFAGLAAPVGVVMLDVHDATEAVSASCKSAGCCTGWHAPAP